MLGEFSLESILAAREMLSFAECADDEKMVFGVCRKKGGSSDGEKEFDTDKKSKQEEDLEAEAKKKGVDLNSKMNKKPIEIGGKKYGLAVKNGKVVMVEWGSVAGEKKPPAPKKKKKPVPGAGQSRGGSGTAGLNRGSQEAYIRGQQAALANQTTDAGRAAIQANIDRARAGA